MKTNQTKFAALVMILFVSGLVGQENLPTGCEENEARLDSILIQMEERKDPRDVFIIIARLGDGEQSLETSRRRLHNAKEYLLIRRDVPAIKRNQIVTALGDRTSGLGRIELYIGGKLVDRLLVGKNRGLCVDCCENHHITPYRKTVGTKGS
jgi:hypothetical protein